MDTKGMSRNCYYLERVTRDYRESVNSGSVYEEELTSKCGGGGGDSGYLNNSGFVDDNNSLTASE